MQPLQFVVVTGLSGAGKTQALRALEDLGFFCVDNLPPALLETFADLCLHSRQRVEHVGLVIDVRGGDFFADLLSALEALKARGIRHRLVYLDADDEVLLRRFEETRRRHPLSSDGGLADSIRDERELLSAVRARADVVLNTTELAPNLLKRKLAAALTDVSPSEGLQVQVLSFGFKHGLPVESDLVFDVRFLPNPHHEPTLRRLTGLEAEVKSYILAAESGREYMERLKSFLTYCLPEYAKEGKAYLTISIGCTGGRHRSVMMAEEVASWSRDLGYDTIVKHRDLQSEVARMPRPQRRASRVSTPDPGDAGATPSPPSNSDDSGGATDNE